MGVVVREKQKGSGIWWIFVNHRGVRKSKKVGGKAAAEKAAEQIRARLTLGKAAFARRQPEKPPAPTLNQYWKRFEQGYLAVAVKPKTLEGYRWAIEGHVLPRFGSKRLDELVRLDVEQLVAELMEQKKAKDSIRLIVAALRKLFNHAIEHGIVSVNPAVGHGKLYKHAERKRAEVEPLAPAEAVAFLKAAREHYPAYYPLFLAALHTGMRPGELAGLQWGDIDWHGSFITVRHNFQSGRLQSTKTDRIRRVDLSDELAAVLRQLQKLRREEWLKKGSSEIPETVFCTPDGRSYDFAMVKRHQFKKALGKAKLRDIRFYDLRHTFATLLIMQGESLAYVRDQMGHSSIQQTVDTYTHWIPSSNRQAVNQLPTVRTPVPEEEKAADAV